MSAGHRVRVIVANDADIIVEGLRGLLAPYADCIEVVGTATGDPELVHEAYVHAEADVVLIDAFGRSDSGIDAVEVILRSDPSMIVAVFTEAEDLRHLFAALRAGARGYLLKSISPNELVDALERVAAGEIVLDRRLAAEAAFVAARSTAHLPWPGAHLGLSRREADVLHVIARGRSLQDAADELHIGRETVRTHLQQVYRKLGVNDRGAAVARAWREGLGG